MNENFTQGKAVRSLGRWLCFIMIGIGALSNPLNLWNPYNIGIGVIWGLLFGGLFRMFLHRLLRLLNHQLKKEKGKQAIRYAVDSAMMFITPFAFMIIIAVFYLGWSMTMPFITAGIMAVGTASTIELNKMMGKPGIRNTIATALVSNIFSLFWTLSFAYVKLLPTYAEGGMTLVRSLLGGGGL